MLYMSLYSCTVSVVCIHPVLVSSNHRIVIIVIISDDVPGCERLFPCRRRRRCCCCCCRCCCCCCSAAAAAVTTVYNVHASRVQADSRHIPPPPPPPPPHSVPLPGFSPAGATSEPEVLHHHHLSGILRTCASPALRPRLAAPPCHHGTLAGSFARQWVLAARVVSSGRA